MASAGFQELVSRLTIDSVEMHCGANTYHASKENAVGRAQVAAIIGVSVVASWSPVADSAYTVPSAPTATSRAAKPGINAIAICQLKPIGANTTCNRCPSCPARLYWIGGPTAPGGGAGKLERNHSRIISERMIVPTRVVNILV